MNVNAVPWLASEILKPQYQDVVSDLWSEMLSALGILGFLPRDMNKSSPVHPDIDSGLPGNVAPNRRIETSKSGSTVAKIGPQSMALTSKASLSIQRTCTCGQSFLDDFVELRPGAAREYETQLRHFANITHANGLSRSSHLSIIGPWLSYLSPWKTQRRSLLPHNVAPAQCSTRSKGQHAADASGYHLIVGGSKSGSDVPLTMLSPAKIRNEPFTVGPNRLDIRSDLLFFVTK